MMSNNHIEQLKLRAQLTYEKIISEFDKERSDLDSEFIRANRLGGGAYILKTNTLVKKHFADACEQVGEIFKPYASDEDAQEIQLRTALRESIAEFWNKLEKRLENHINSYKESAAISPSWNDFVAWKLKMTNSTIYSYIEEPYAKHILQKRRGIGSFFLRNIGYIVSGIVGVILTKIGDKIWALLVSQ